MADNRRSFLKRLLRSGQACSPGNLRLRHNSASSSLDPTSRKHRFDMCCFGHYVEFGTSLKGCRSKSRKFSCPNIFMRSLQKGNPSLASITHTQQHCARKSGLCSGSNFSDSMDSFELAERGHWPARDHYNLSDICPYTGLWKKIFPPLAF